MSVDQSGFLNLIQAQSNFSGNVRFAGFIDSGSSTTTINIKNAGFITDQFIGLPCAILNFNNAGDWREITANTGNSITVTPAFASTPTAGATIVIYNFGISGTGNSVTIGNRDGETIDLATGIDISGGVNRDLGNYNRWSLYLSVAGAIDITVRLSPNGGANNFLIDESPISFAAAGEKVIEFGYTANHIILVGSNSTNVRAQIRGAY